MTDVKLAVSEFDLGQITDWLYAKRGHPIGIDTETTGLDIVRDDLKSIQFSDGAETWVVPVELCTGSVWGMVCEEIEKSSHYCHNPSYDRHFLERVGIDIFGRCTAIRARLADPRRNSYKLDALSNTAVQTKELKAYFKETGYNYATVPVDDAQMLEYAGRDAEAVVELAHRYEQGKAQLEDQVNDIIYRATKRGFPVDIERIRNESDNLFGEKLVRETKATREYGIPIVGAGSQNALQNYLKINNYETGETATGRRKTSADDLEPFADDPVIKLILEHRKLNKVASNWIDRFRSEMIDGRVHPQINVLGAVTGRMTSWVLTFPRTAQVRGCLAAHPGKILAAVDYSQMEMRIIAQATFDKALQEACLTSDPHTENAKRLFDVAEPTQHQRFIAKSSFFAVAYGAQPARLMSQYGFDYHTAVDAISRLNRAFPRAMNLNAVADKYIEGDMLVNPYGRRVFCPVFMRKNSGNYLVQSIGVDVFKRALIRLDNTEVRDNLILPYHDEALYEFDIEDAERKLQIVIDVMRDDDYDPPLITDGSLFMNWGEKYE